MMLYKLQERIKTLYGETLRCFFFFKFPLKRQKGSIEKGVCWGGGGRKQLQEIQRWVDILRLN